MEKTFKRVSMKFLTASVVFGLCFFFGTAQIKNAVPDFKNERDQEDYWAKTLFEGKHLRETIEKYKGQIIKVNNHTFTYCIFQFNYIPGFQLKRLPLSRPQM